MNVLKRAALCALLLIPGLAYAQYAVSGRQVQYWPSASASSQLMLPNGLWCFGADCRTITNGQFSGYESGTATVTIKDATGAILLTVPNVSIAAPFVWDNYTVLATAVISGKGKPTIAASAGATYLQTDSSYANSTWTYASGWNRNNPSSPAATGSYAGTGAPTFVCTSPCSYTQSDASTQTNAFWTLVAASGTQSSNWQLQGGAIAGVTSFNSRTGAVTPQSADYNSYYDASGAAAARAGTGNCSSGQYETADGTSGPTCAQPSFSDLNGQATNAQLPATLSAPTTGNAGTATALAATPSPCGGGVAVGIAANGTAQCNVLQTQTVTGVSSVNFTSWPNTHFKTIEILITNLTISATGYVILQLSTDGGSHYDSSTCSPSCTYNQLGTLIVATGGPSLGISTTGAPGWCVFPLKSSASTCATDLIPASFALPAIVDFILPNFTASGTNKGGFERASYLSTTNGVSFGSSGLFYGNSSGNLAPINAFRLVSNDVVTPITFSATITVIGMN